MLKQLTLNCFSKEKLQVFCKNSSLRGVSKIVNSPSLLLRIIWCLYVFVMLFLLTFSVANSLYEYLAYDTTVQTSIKLDHLSDFPAMTICNHYPFSEDARDMWKKGQVQSPTEYNYNLRQIIRKLILEKEFNKATNIYMQDKLSSYYQNLSLDDALSISHTVPQFFKYCFTKTQDNNLIYSDVMDNCGLRVITYSHPHFFNCHIVEGTEDFSKILDSVSIIVTLPQTLLYGGRKTNEHEQAFVQNVFEQAVGVRISVHEPETFPDIERHGVHLESGRMVEIMYKVVQNIESDNPKDRCLKKKDYETFTIKDLKEPFRYTSDACVYAKTNEVIEKRCNCTYAQYVRPNIPTQRKPYCGQIDENNIDGYFKRLKCLSNITQDTELRKKLEKSDCLQRCEAFSYDTHMSSTVWNPTDWQLHWSLTTGKAFNYMEQVTFSNSSSMIDIMKFLDSTDLRKTSESSSFFTKNSSYVYITLKRSSRDTELREKKLQLTLNAMFSRVGGLCSLYLGLTLAFFIEIFEFFYLLRKQKLEKRENDRRFHERSPPQVEEKMLVDLKEIDDKL